jgi:photoactive yellow protein
MQPGPTGSAAATSFAAPDLLQWLELATHADLDALPFGLIAMALDGTVEHYNTAEAKLARLIPEQVVGRNFFTSVAPCTNNFMVARRFEAEPAIDDVVHYVFTFRFAPLKVRLRLLKQPGARRMYLAVEMRD